MKEQRNTQVKIAYDGQLYEATIPEPPSLEGRPIVLTNDAIVQPQWGTAATFLGICYAHTTTSLRRRSPCLPFSPSPCLRWPGPPLRDPPADARRRARVPLSLRSGSGSVDVGVGAVIPTEACREEAPIGVLSEWTAGGVPLELDS